MLNELYHIATPWAKATKSQINVNRMLEWRRMSFIRYIVHGARSRNRK